MPHTRKDTVATVLAAAVVVIYVGYLWFDGIPFVEDVRGMAAVGLVLSFAGRRIGGRHGFRHQHLAMAANIGSLALGFAALATESTSRPRAVHRVDGRPVARRDLRPNRQLPHRPPAALALTYTSTT